MTRLCVETNVNVMAASISSGVAAAGCGSWLAILAVCGSAGLAKVQAYPAARGVINVAKMAKVIETVCNENEIFINDWRRHHQAYKLAIWRGLANGG
jgi:hypothetical protein